MTFRLVTHSGCLHLSNTQLRARQKTKLLKLHKGLWCRVCAPYGYVPLSHLGNIVLSNEIPTFHNGGISSSKCVTLIISIYIYILYIYILYSLFPPKLKSIQHNTKQTYIQTRNYKTLHNIHKHYTAKAYSYAIYFFANNANRKP